LNRRTVFETALILLLVSALIFVFNVPVSRASGTVYIRADGSIDPSSANITSADNVTYTLIGNVNDSVVVQRANIGLDGAGYTIQGTGSGIGINVTSVSNVTIKNCIITNWRVGIYLDVGANNGIVRNNTIQGMSGAQGEDAVGIHLKSNYNRILNNTMLNVTGGIGATEGIGGTSAGIYLSSSSGNNLSSNIITDLTGGTGGVNGGNYRPGGSGGVSAGICLVSSPENAIALNSIAGLTGGIGGTAGWAEAGGSGGTAAGIYLSSSAGNNLTSNAIANLTGGTGGTGGWGGGGGSGGTSGGIYLVSSTANNLTSNTIANLRAGKGGTGGGDTGCGGSGGTSAGICLSNSTGNSLISSTMANLTGGTGGAGGGEYAAGGAEGTSAAIWIDTASYNNRIAPITTLGSHKILDISKSSTIEGKPILYFYNETSLEVSSFNITTNTAPILIGGSTATANYGKVGGSGGTSTGIAFVNTTSSIIENITISGFKGMPGGTAGYQSSGGCGGTMAGICLLNSIFNNLTSNTITYLEGRTGGTGQYLYGSGGAGGTAAGMYLSSSTGNNLVSNTMANLTGGAGGSSGRGGSGGFGGTSTGIYLSNSTTNSLTSNIMTGLRGGAGGGGTYGGSGGAGGTSAGIYVLNSTGNSLTANTIANLTAGTAGGGSKGGTGGTATGVCLYYSVGNNLTANTMASLAAGLGTSGGPSGTSAGMWLDIDSINNRLTNLVTQGSYKIPDTSKLNTIEGKSILYFYDEAFLKVFNFNVTTITAPILIGGSTATGTAGNPGGPGASGGISTGIALMNVTSSIIGNITISGFEGMPGGTGGYYGGSGGAGGIATGIYVSNSTENSLMLGTISNLKGGTGGIGALGGSSGSQGASCSLYLRQSNSVAIKENTVQTLDYGIYLDSSNYSIIYHNNFLGNASRISSWNSNSTWNIGYPSGGNYWSNYTGVDNYRGPYQNETGSDGIGDTPYQVDQFNKDNYPIMTQGPWVTDIAITNVTLSTTEAYAGQTIDINVTAKNWGDLYESFNVTVYCETTTIGTQEVTLLAPDTQTTLTFNWNTTDIGGGHYTVSTNASVVPEEINTTNNILTGGTIKVTSPVRIVEVVPCNQTGYLKDTFQQGTLAYFKVTLNSTALIPQNTLITVNLYDNDTITIGVASFKAPIMPGISTIIFGLPIPATATTGTATVYANAYTDWPSLGGFPHCPEMSATLEITEP